MTASTDVANEAPTTTSTGTLTDSKLPSAIAMPASTRRNPIPLLGRPHQTNNPTRL